MFSYAGARRPAQEGDGSIPAITELLNRCMSPSDTTALARNYLHHGVYVLHGDKDDNVPVSQARTMKQQLESIHKDFEYYEEPNAGHWWGKDLSEFAKEGATWGTACVDWPPMFHFFMRHSMPEADTIRNVEFITASPGVSAASGWATIWAQLVQLRPSSIEMHYEPTTRTFHGVTSNVARLTLNVRHVPGNEPVQIELDGQELRNVSRPETGTIWLSRNSGDWSVIAPIAAAMKGPHRYGTFKDAFRNRMIFVYGTKGTAQENDWSISKASYDAEQFWYRGNGSIDLISDSTFNSLATEADPEWSNRNVVLYGNAETNAAWAKLLGGSPVQVTRDRVVCDNRELQGEDLAALFIQPRPGSDMASVGVVSGTGTAGMRLTERIPYFTSGVALPDLTIFGSEMLTGGLNGVRAAGFFGLDWQVGSGEILWRDGND